MMSDNATLGLARLGGATVDEPPAAVMSSPALSQLAVAFSDEVHAVIGHDQPAVEALLAALASELPNAEAADEGAVVAKKAIAKLLDELEDMLEALSFGPAG